jgi:hypothetical protein
MRGATVEVKCACGTMFTARVADRKRGWAKSCSKSCAARRSNEKTGKFEKFLQGGKFAYYAKEYGGTPQFDRKGEYEGFTGQFSNEEHDCNKD